MLLHWLVVFILFVSTSAVFTLFAEFVLFVSTSVEFILFVSTSIESFFCTRRSVAIILGNSGVVSLERVQFLKYIERSEAESFEAEGRSASPWGH